jgi:hypothetical protein
VVVEVDCAPYDLQKRKVQEEAEEESAGEEEDEG